MNRRDTFPLRNCLDNFKKSYGDLDKLSTIKENWEALIGLELFKECKPLNIEKKNTHNCSKSSTMAPSINLQQA